MFGRHRKSRWRTLLRALLLLGLLSGGLLLILNTLGRV